MSTGRWSAPPPQRCLRSRLKRKHGEDSTQVRLRLTALCGGTWAPSRKAARGMVEGDKCGLCGKEGGDVLHQLWTCEATAKARIELGLDDLAARGRQCGFRPRVTWECGIPHVPEVPQSDAIKAPLNVGIVEGSQRGAMGLR